MRRKMNVIDELGELFLQAKADHYIEWIIFNIPVDL